VASLEREFRLFMIEKGRLPLVAVVAGGAILAASPELFGVRVLMALATCCGGARKLNMQHCQLHVRRLVAIGTGHGSMRTYQRKLCTLVVEFREILPFLGRVAGLAAKRLAKSIVCSHSFGKLAFMNVLMASGAAKSAEVINHHL